MDLKDCVPADKHDLAAVRRARKLGFPAINPILPDLLAWLIDSNWPVAPELARLLSGAGPEIVPHLIAILQSQDDNCGRNHLLNCVMPELDKDLRDRISPQLRRIAVDPTPGEVREAVAEVAARVLEGWEIDGG